MRGLFPMRPVIDAPPDPGSQIFNTAGTHNLIALERVFRIRASLVGPAGNGGASSPFNTSGGAGGGGAFARDTIDVTPGQTLECIVGTPGFATSITGYFLAASGQQGSGTTGGPGGVATAGVALSYPGGRGGNGAGGAASEQSPGGGGAAGENGPGNHGQDANGAAFDPTPAGLYSGAAQPRRYRARSNGTLYGGGGSGASVEGGIHPGIGAIGHILLEWGPDIT